MSQGIPKEFWDERFSEEGFAYGDRPSRLLMGWSDTLAQDDFWDALVPASGEGRDAVYLAQLGLDVTALDISTAGHKKAQKLAERCGVEIDTVEADLFQWTWPTDKFDVIAAMFAHMPSAVRAVLHQKYIAALKPGGFVFIEGFTRDQIAYQAKYQSGGPPDMDMLYAADDIRADFNGLEELSLMVGVETLEEGHFHTGPAAVLRAVFRKPTEFGDT